MEKIRTGIGGLDSDSELRDVAAGDFPCGQIDVTGVPSVGAINVRVGITDQGNDGTVENTKGNQLINYPLPAGNNKTIGTKQDDLTGTITYFNYNDQNNHTILQYSWVTGIISLIAQGIALGFDVNHKITGINLIGGMLYWTDGNQEPRKINYVNAIANTGTSYGPYPANIGGIDRANTFTQGQLNLKEYTYRIKTPPLYPPSAVYFSDTKRTTNYLDGFLFQFQYRYIYDDFEKSAFSPISIVPLPELNSALFTDSTVNNQILIGITTGSAIVKKIEIGFRIGNTGPLQSAIVLDKSDPYNLLGDLQPYLFKFYNDNLYSLVDPADAAKLYDSVPKKSVGQDLIDPTRLADGNVTDGFDPVPIITKLGVSFPPVTTKTFSIQCNANGVSPNQTPLYNFPGPGGVHIISPWTTSVDNNGIIASQPIWENPVDSPGLTVFGGMQIDFPGTSSSNPMGHIPTTQMRDNYGQVLPLNGFVFYLAGTNNYGISKQVNPNGGVSSTVSYSSSTGVISLDSNVLNNYTILSDLIKNRMVYSEFSIDGVAPGKYVMRVADHGTQASDLLDTSLSWQKKSTFTALLNNKGTTEVIIEIYFNTTDNKFHSVVDGVDSVIDPKTNVINIGRCYICDLSYGASNTLADRYTSVESGYLVDHDNKAVVPAAGISRDQYMLAETRIELSKITYSAAFTSINTTPSWPLVSTWNNLTPATFTDHNGFFFFGRAFFSSYGAPEVAAIGNQCGSLASTSNSTYDQVGSAPNTGAYNRRVFMRTPSFGFFNNHRTQISIQNVRETVGGITIQLPDIAVVINRGKFALTDVKGNATIIVYADINDVRADKVFYKTEDKTFFDSFSPVVTNTVQGNVFVPNTTERYYDYFNIGFGATATAGSTTSQYGGIWNFLSLPLQLVSISVNLIGKNASISALKRAGTYQYGIVYYDHANRSGVTMTNSFASAPGTSLVLPTKDQVGLQLYIPYYTEMVTATGPIYGGATPQVNWEIWHQPPSWATHYQWTRTKNSANNRFLQFTINSAKYLDSNNAPSTYAGGATKIAIDLNNITIFNAQNINTIPATPGIGLVYDWIQKPSDDHFRLIRDENGNFYGSYIDTLVIGWDPGKGILTIENTPNIPDLSTGKGQLFEVYNPKLQLPPTEELFWEVGECYPINNPGTPIAVHGAGANGIPQVGPFVNSVMGIPASIVPATGVFIGGDIYYRVRNMPYDISNPGPPSKTDLIEDASVSDFYVSQISDIGRPNKLDPDYKEVNRPSTVFYSEPYIPETNINGLSSVFDTSFETYEIKYGGIYKLYNENHWLNVFQQLKIGGIPINQNIIYDNASTNNLASSVLVLNQIKYYEGEYGISTHPEAFAFFGQAKYCLDVNRLTPLRLSQDGLKPIDENESKTIKMHKYFKDKLAFYKKYPGSFIYGVFDKRFKNYIIAFEAIYPQPVPTPVITPVPIVPAGTVVGNQASPVISTIIAASSSSGTVVNPNNGSIPGAKAILPAETIVWNELTNRWTSKFNFNPDFMCGNEDTIVSFHAGKLYVHNSSTVPFSNFYGQQYQPEVDFVAKGSASSSQLTNATAPEPSKVKVLQAISEETTAVFEAQITTPEGQMTKVISQDFQNIEGLQYAPVSRDYNTPNVVNAAVEGDIIRSTHFLVRLTLPILNAAKAAKIFCLNMIEAGSERSNR